VFDNRVLRRVFRPERDEVAGGCSKLHYEELCNLYYSRNIIRMIKSRRMKWVEHVTRKGEMRNAFKVEKLEGKRLLGRTRLRCEDNIKMGL
jgi:hypothetical protein